MEILRVFAPLEEFEFTMFKLYRWFSNVLADDAAAVAVFRKMAREELDHRDIVRHQKKLVMNNYRSFSDVTIDIDRIRSVTAELDAFMRERSHLTVKEAVSFAVRMETDALEHHFRMAIMESSPILRELIGRLQKADKIHLDRILTFAERHFIDIDTSSQSS